MLPYGFRIRMARSFNCGSCIIIGILFFLICYFISRISEVLDDGHHHVSQENALASHNQTNNEAYWRSLDFANDTESSLMVIFSAIQDIDHGSIKVLGIARRGINFADSLWCVFKDKSGSREYTIRPSIEIIPIHLKKGKKSVYVPVLIVCDLRDVQLFVSRTSIKIKHKDSSSEWIPILSPDSSTSDPVTCVLPLEAESDRNNHILEFIAYYKVNGINQFSFFDSGVTEEVFETLHSFQPIAKVQVHKIGIPEYISPNKVSLPVLNAIALHFCLHKFVNQPIIAVTINDLIAPRHADLNSYISKKLAETDDTATLVVPMVLFCEENNFNKAIGDEFQPSMVNQNRRQISIFPHHIHSRVIVLRPKMVKFLGGHFTLEMSPGYDGKEEDTDSEEVLLFNYKPCTGVLTKNQIKEQVMTDNRLEIFRDEIISILRSRKP